MQVHLQVLVIANKVSADSGFFSLTFSVHLDLLYPELVIYGSLGRNVRYNHLTLSRDHRCYLIVGGM